MQETIQAGTVFFRDGTLFPEALEYHSQSYSAGWRLLQGLDGFALDRKIHDAGWHFLYFAGESSVTVFGHDEQKTVRKGIKRILAGLKLEKNNAFEITRVTLKTLVGVPYMSVSFHTRNIQESMLPLRGQTALPWKDAQIAAA